MNAQWNLTITAWSCAPAILFIHSSRSTFIPICAFLIPLSLWFARLLFLESKGERTREGKDKEGSLSELRPIIDYAGQNGAESGTIIHSRTHTKSNRRDRNRNRTIRPEVASLYWMSDQLRRLRQCAQQIIHTGTIGNPFAECRRRARRNAHTQRLSQRFAHCTGC